MRRRASLLLCASVVALVCITPGAAFAAALSGTIVDRASGQPVAEVQVAIPALDKRVATDRDGRFTFEDLPAGDHQLLVTGPHLDPVEVTEALRADERRVVRYLAHRTPLRATTYETVVRASRLGRELIETRLDREEASRVAGTQGDPLKVLDNLGGVARASFGSGQLVVWGSAPRDTRVYLDGVELSSLYHLGGLRSTLNAELVDRIALSPGGYGPAYGRGLGGLVRVESRGLPTEGVHGYVGVDLLDASAMVTAAIGKRVQLAFAARYSVIDRIAARLFGEAIGDYVPIPRYDDYQLKANVRLRSDESLSLLFTAADDHLHRAIGAADPNSARREDTDLASYRVILRYRRDPDAGTQIEVSPFWGWDDSARSTRFGDRATRLDVTTMRYGVRASYRGRLSRFATLALGLDLFGSRADVVRQGSITVPTREGDIYVFGRAPGDDVAADRYRVDLLEAAPYIASELRFGPVTLNPGLRLNAIAIAGNRSAPQSGDTPVLGFQRVHWTAEPRLAIAIAAHRVVTIHLAAGLYHQAPAIEDLSAVFGTPTLGLERSVHVTAGANVVLRPRLALELLGFFKYLDHLVTRSALSSPPVAQALTQDGTGRSYGGQILLRHDPWHGFSGWISYTLSRSERVDHPGRATRLFDFDQTHSLAVVATYAYRGWSFGARLRYSSGYPRTPVVGAFYDARDDQFQPRFGAQNTIRIGDFAQLDLRVDKTITLSAKVALTLYLDVLNVTYRRNPEELAYSLDYAQRGAITGLPTTAIAGAKVAF